MSILKKEAKTPAPWGERFPFRAVCERDINCFPILELASGIGEETIHGD